MSYFARLGKMLRKIHEDERGDIDGGAWLFILGVVVGVVVTVVLVAMWVLFFGSRSPDVVDEAEVSVERPEKAGDRTVLAQPMVIVPGGDGMAPKLLVINQTRGSSSGSVYLLSYTAVEGDRRETLWDAQVEDRIYNPDNQITFDAFRLYLARENTVRAFSLADGGFEWKASLSDKFVESYPGCMQIHKNRLLVSSVDSVLHAFDVGTGELVWSYRTRYDFGSRLALLIVGDMVVLMDRASEEGSAPMALYVLDVETGDEIHRLKPECAHEESSYVRGMYAGDRLYPGEEKNTIYVPFDECVQLWDVEKGEMVRGRRRPESDVSSSLHLPDRDEPFVMEGHVLYMGEGMMSHYDGLVTFDLESGEYRTLLEETDYSIQLLAKQGDTFIVRAKRERGTEQDEMWAFDASSGEVLWKHGLQRTELMGRDPGASSGDDVWAFSLTREGVAVVQIIPHPDVEDSFLVAFELIDAASGELSADNKADMGDDGYLRGITWTKDAAYLSFRDGIYTLDLATGEMTFEWP